MKSRSKNLVSFEIALLAKEKSFKQDDVKKSIISYDYYDAISGELNGNCLKTKEEISKIKELNPNAKIGDFLRELVYAPTYDELLYWLRTTKFLHIATIPYSKTWTYEIYDLDKETMIVYKEKTEFSDYYQMLQIALKKTLNLC